MYQRGLGSGEGVGKVFPLVDSSVTDIFIFQCNFFSSIFFTMNVTQCEKYDIHYVKYLQWEWAHGLPMQNLMLHSAKLPLFTYFWRGSLFFLFLHFKKITFGFKMFSCVNHIRWWCYCLTGAVKNLIESFGILTLVIYTTLYVYGHGYGAYVLPKALETELGRFLHLVSDAFQLHSHIHFNWNSVHGVVPAIH